ncbi:hypothetical protein ACVWWK_006339 [Bradyrhizobium sp. LB9.1b]
MRVGARSQGAVGPGPQGAFLSLRQGLRRNSRRTGLEPHSDIVRSGECRLGMWMIQMKTNPAPRAGRMGARQIYDALRDQILARVYGIDGLLPSSRALAGRDGCGPLDRQRRLRTARRRRLYRDTPWRAAACGSRHRRARTHARGVGAVGAEGTAVGLRRAVASGPAAQLRGIVGVRIPVVRFEGKRKMSQNRPEADRVGVAQGLAASENALDREVAPLIPVPM